VVRQARGFANPSSQVKSQRRLRTRVPSEGRNRLAQSGATSGVDNTITSTCVERVIHDSSQHRRRTVAMRTHHHRVGCPGGDVPHVCGPMPHQVHSPPCGGLGLCDRKRWIFGGQLSGPPRTLSTSVRPGGDCKGMAHLRRRRGRASKARGCAFRTTTSNPRRGDSHRLPHAFSCRSADRSQLTSGLQVHVNTA
jgi:hypothetical protein